MSQPAGPSAAESSASSSAPPPSSSNPDDLAEIGHYVVTSHPPGSVFSSVKCSFLAENSTDVIVAKSNRLEVRRYHQPSSLGEGGSAGGGSGGVNDSIDGGNDANLFPLLLSLPINGRIINIAPIRFTNAKKDCLFFLTEKGSYALISYDETLAGNNAGTISGMPPRSSSSSSSALDIPTGEHYPIQTHISGSLKNYTEHVLAGGRECECGPLMAVDPLFRCIALHLYDGYITVIPINVGYDAGRFKRVPWRRNGVGNAAAAAGAKGAASSLAGGSGKPPPTKQHRGLSGPPFADALHLRIEERTLLSITFLKPCDQKKSLFVPQLAVLHQDARGFQHVTSHGIDLSKKKLIMNGMSSSASGNRQRHKGVEDGKKPAASLMPPPGEQLKCSKVEGGSGCLIAVPPPKDRNASLGMDRKIPASKALGGVIILGQTMITYHSTSEGITRLRPTGGALLLSYCRVLEPETDNFMSRKDETEVLRYLLGDERGRLHLLSLTRNKDGLPTTLHLDALGTCTTSSSLTYLGNGHLFVGSSFGNSQLVKILDSPVEVGTSAAALGGLLGREAIKGGPLMDTTYVEVLEEYDNLGPIVDFDLRPADDSDSGASSKVEGGRYRQSLVATCSGVAKDGTVRLVRNGVGMREHAAVDMGGIKGMWSLRRKFGDGDDSFLVQSFVRETRILGVQSVKDVEMEDEEEKSEMEEEEEEEDEQGALAEVTIDGFNSSKPTLFAGNLLVGKLDLLLQVVEDSVRLVDSETLELVVQWSPFGASDEDSDDDEPMGFITVASANESGQIVVALRGGALVYLLVEGGNSSTPAIRRVRKVTLDREISCVDLNPFGSSSTTVNSGDLMDIDSSNSSSETRKSQLVAVGLWDDFSVRLLNLMGDPSTVLEQVLHINLGRGGNESSTRLSGSDNDADDQLGEGGQHMMARSLCLVTMDSQSTNNSNSIMNKNTHSSSMSGNSVDMLLVGLGDGKLISFVVNPPTASSSNNWSIHSRKEVSLGTQGIHLIPFQHGCTAAETNKSSSGSCVLATGDRPTVVYLTGGNAGSNSNPKLNYSTISLTVDEDEDDEEDGGGHASHKNISVNVAAPFRSSLLFSSSSNATGNSSSLCVADDNTLRLGVIDDIQKLHVTTYKLGMTPRRIAHHEAGRVYCVGCIGGGWGEVGGEQNQNNCVRFFDDSTFEELNCIELEPFEMILSIQSVSLSINAPPSRSRQSAADTTGPVEYRPFIVMGTAYAYPDEDEPSSGRVLVVECNSGNAGNLKSDSDDDQMMMRQVRQVADLPLMGGIYSIAPFYGGNILVTCGSKTLLCQLSASVVTREFGGEPGELMLNEIGSGHHGHLISLFVKSLVSSDKSLQKNTQKEKRQLAIVGDLMRSISLVEYFPKHQVVEELARDFNSNYCTEIAMLTKNIYMGSEGHNNLFVLRYNPDATTEQARVRLDTMGQYHLGESVNKMMGGSLIMPSSTGTGSAGTAANGKPSSEKPAFANGNRKIDITIGSQTLYGTVDGTIGSILGLGGKTFAFLTALQRAMDAIVRPVGDLSRAQYRAWEQEQKRHGSCGFVDGDWIETFLDLGRPTMEQVVKEMNTDRKWSIRDDGKGFDVSKSNNQQSLMDTEDDHGMGSNDPRSASNAGGLTVEDVLGAVEELSMLH